MFKQNAFGAVFSLVIVGAVAVVLLNGSGSSTFESGKVIRHAVGADKHQAFDTMLFVEVPDGRVVSIGLVNGTVPPKAGTVVKLRRVKRIWFGDFFMLAP